MTVSMLATDMDGTLIPLPEAKSENTEDLQLLKDLIQCREIRLAYVTGRHRKSVEQAIREFNLPVPEFLVCDVGTTILQYRKSRGGFEDWPHYACHLHSIVADQTVETVRELCFDIRGLQAQEPEKQGPFKVSFYCERKQLTPIVDVIVHRLTRADSKWSVISSVDPFNGQGLIDVLPLGVSKAFALDYLARKNELPSSSIIFCGDSGNDMAALTAGFRSVVVGNAPEELKSAVRSLHQKKGWNNRLFIAQRYATSGVIEGVRHFLGES